MEYRTRAQLMREYSYKKYKSVNDRINFIETHPERYPSGSVKRNDAGRVLVDIAAFDDAYTYRKSIERGIAPAFGGTS